MAARGRHRRNRTGTLSRTSLKVTAGSAGVALPLVGAQLVQAAPADVWQKVAACESNGDWEINTGNGHFGGLQFSQSTWEAYGGTAYAARADLASKSQQIAVAEKVLAGQGPKAWPNCGPRNGLSRGGTQPQAARAAADARQATVREKARKEATERAERAEAERAERAAKAERARADRSKKATTYEVVGGDSLSSIADEHGVAGGWPALYERNRKTVGGDPDLILPGQRIQLSGKQRPGKPAAESESESGGEAGARAKAGAGDHADPGGERKADAGPDRKAEQQKKQKKEGEQKEQKEQKPKEQKAAAPARKPTKPSPAAASAPVSGVSPGTAYRASGSSWSSGHHTGVDFPVPTGTKVKAVSAAKVVSAGWADAYGYEVVLRHRDGRYSQYGHLSAISVRAGQSVMPGQRLGRSGSTGNTTGPHLHFEIRTGPGYGTDIDPLGYLRGRGVRL